MLCKDCFHSQLSVVVKPELLFKNYLYVSGTTKTFRNHCNELAKDAVKRVKGKLSVLDIACNDGTQLEYFRELGCEVVGIDPAENLRKITLAKDIPVYVKYWGQKTAKIINQKFDLITGTNVFAHVDDLDDFLLGVKLALKDDGILILEFPYAKEMISNNEFDTVYHEHLSFFTVNSFKALMDRMGFGIIDVIQTPIHGGSIRFFVGKNIKKHSKKIDILIKIEKEKGLLKTKSYLQFSDRVKKNKQDFLKLIDKLRKNNEKIIGYGASAKGNTMLNYFKVDLDYIVDDNELKHGFKTPGRNIIIKKPNELAKETQRLNIVILSWNFYKEIAKKIISQRNKRYNDRAIVYVPKIAIKIISEYESFNISA
jgi:SAM-dependent methyltransferase